MKCHIKSSTVVRILQKSAPTVKISANSFTTHIKLSTFVLFISAGKNIHFERICICIFVFWPLFVNFTRFNYATLTMGNRFLEVQISGCIWRPNSHTTVATS